MDLSDRRDLYNGFGDALSRAVELVVTPAIFGFLGWLGATLPFALTVALVALELLVAFLQAYVFTILTCIYLNDAVHPGH